MVSFSELKEHAPAFAKEIAKHLKSDGEKLVGIVDKAVHGELRKHYHKLTKLDLLTCVADNSYISLTKLFKLLYQEEYDYQKKEHQGFLRELERKLDDLVGEGKLITAQRNCEKYIEKCYRLALQRD